MFDALNEIVDLSFRAFSESDIELAKKVEPLDQVILDLKEQVRLRHVIRLQQGKCSLESGFVLLDILTHVERTAAHCSNIAGTIMDFNEHNYNTHESLREYRRENINFRVMFDLYSKKYALAYSERK